jgi:hydroxymethylglutaryl-CoA reductase
VTRQHAKTSRLPGFYRHDLPRRLDLICVAADLSDEAAQHLAGGGGITPNVADVLSENVIATHGLPLSVAVNFRVNSRDVLVPMAVEEPSVVAAASNAARIARLCGGFQGEADAPVMTAQVQLDGVPLADTAPALLEACKDRLLALGDEAIPRMVARGGGCRDFEVRVLCPDAGIVVVDVYVDVRDAMGANIVDSVAEAMAPGVQELIGGMIGLRILTNLPLRRMVRVSARLSLDAVGGRPLAEGIVRASRFAELDGRRAVTHNKGIMNGVDAVAVALGQDWRSIEAGAHAYAGMGDGYRPLATWRIDDDDRLVGELEMPMAVGTVGGSTRAHGGVRAAFEIIGIQNAGDLGIVIAAAGLASNLAALRALAGEGIQKGHMRLHHRKTAVMEEQAEAEARTGSQR